MDGWDSGFGWKDNWAESRQHFIDWWNRKGLVATTWGAHIPAAAPRAEAAQPPHEPDPRARCENVEWRAQGDFARLARADYGLDIIPLAGTDIGPGSLALALGCEPGFSPETVWFEPAWKDAADVRDLPPPRFNPHAHWWKIHEAQIRAHTRLADGAYLAGLPDLVENVDILSALRDPQTLMVDMIENPGWVEARMTDINTAWFEAFDRLYNLAKGPDGGNGWGAFNLWGPGKTAKVQCDACAMFSPEMFGRFVTPALTAQCEWLDYSMYHLDGTQCVRHLDALLKIEPLDAIEWTPQSGVEPAWHERWHPLYKRVLDAGKALQIVGVPVDRLEYVLDAVGAKGVFIIMDLGSPDDLRRAARVIDRRRK